MDLTVELSMYPFQADYKTLIKDFIDELNTRKGACRVTTGPTATLLSGSYGEVWQLLGELLAWSHEKHGRAVFVAKIIPGMLPEA